MSRILNIVALVLLLISVDLFSATYYSRNGGGNWDSRFSWTLNASGSGAPAANAPLRTDNVIILSTHTIAIDATNDNGSAGVSADGLGYPNVGTYSQSNVAAFYQTGNVNIEVGGTITASVKTMFEGQTVVSGTFTNTDDVINLGNMVLDTGATFSTDDDLICTGFSRTQIDVTINSDDDIYVDHTDATICGAGVMNVGVSSGNTPIIFYSNGATVAQFCNGFRITCGPGGGCSGFPVTGTGGFQFDLSNLSYYKNLTIQSSQVTADLTNFPVLISFSDPDIRTVADGGQVESANGYDIIFSSSSGCGKLSQLYHEIESYSSNTTTGTIIAWVKLPFLSSSVDTDIYMYYGSSDFSTDPSSSGVYDYDYMTVLHLHDDFTDRTVNSIDGTNNSSTNSTGQIGDGQNFISSSTQYIDLGNPSLLNFGTTDFTVSAWVKTTSTAQANIISNGGDDGGGVRYVMAGNEGSGNKLTLTTDNNSAKRQSNSSTNINNNAWHYVVAVRDGTTIRTYVDGVAEGTNTLPGGYDLSSTSQRNAYIGCGHSQASGNRIKFFDGDIDEARISSIFRAPSWTLTEFNNQNSPGTFFTVGSEIANTCPPTVALPIQLIAFNAYVSDNKYVTLNWSTLSETNNDFFTIERSLDLKKWDVIKEIDGAGNSRIKLDYSSIDYEPYENVSYYRLKQTDYDGKFDYSAIEAVDINALAETSLYPNPAQNILVLKSTDAIDAGQIVLTDAMGKSISIASFISKGKEIEIDVSNLESGLYFIHYQMTKKMVVMKFIKN